MYCLESLYNQVDIYDKKLIILLVISTENNLNAFNVNVQFTNLRFSNDKLKFNEVGK